MPGRHALSLFALAAPTLAVLALSACSMKDMAPEGQADEVRASGTATSAPVSESPATADETVALEKARAEVPAASAAAPPPPAEPMAAAAPAPMAQPMGGAVSTGARRTDRDRSGAMAEDEVAAERTVHAKPKAPAKRVTAAPGRTRGDALGGESTPAPDAPYAGPKPTEQLAALGYYDAGDGDDGAIEANTTASADAFQDHGVNPFTLVSDDALSTFSIDVDTASYSVARRKLDSNQLPPEAAVRVEEFINYFDYDSYVAPKNDPFAVNMEAMPDPFRPGHHVLRVGVQGKEISRDERPPVHLVFLVDVSGSMSAADKLGYARKSLHMMVDGLREDDTVALATYAGRVARVLEPTSAANKRAIHDAIEGLKSGGSTAMSSGIDIAYDMAKQQFQPGHENRVVILSDGDANVGRTSWDDMLGQIKHHADAGVTLSTIGFGMGNYQDTLMEQLANNGDGNNFYIDSLEQAQRVFVEELGGTMVTIARDVKLQVEFNPESVAAYRLIGYENRDIADKDFRNDRVDAGEVGSGHNVTALYDVILKDGYAAELATVRMRYEAPGADKAATEKLWVFQDKRLQETASQADRDTRIAYSAATFAEILRGSPHAAEIDLEALARFAEKSARPGEKDDAELVALMRKAKTLGAGNAALVRR